MTTLLVVDQEVNTRLLFKDEFQDEGYEVAVAETAGEALDKIHQSRPDIITLNIKKPDVEGIEFLRKVKTEERDIPVVICSAYAGFRNDFRVGICDAFVVKSADFTELKTIVKRILDRKQADWVLHYRKYPLSSFSSLPPGSHCRY